MTASKSSHGERDATAIESILQEERVFDPPRNFSASVGGAYVSSLDEYKAMHTRSLDDPEGFWGEAASELHWFRKWEPGKVVEWNPPDAKWFVGGKTNLCYNCIDRQVKDGLGNQVAIIWEGEPTVPSGARPDFGELSRTEDSKVPVESSKAHRPGSPSPNSSDPASAYEIRRLTYNELLGEVSRFANALKSLGVKKGDVVTIYMGMVPELAIAMLACARIGAAHSVIFGGFSAQAIVDRAIDADSRILITCDGAWRRGTIVPLKNNVDDACAQLATAKHRVERVIVFKRCGNQIEWNAQRDLWWHEVVAGQSDSCACEQMDSEDMLFLLYTSGSTGKPKGILHTTGGYMVFTYLTAKYVFNLRPSHDQVFWCTADIGWVTGHSYIVYGVLPNRVPTVMYEGAPNHPAPDRFWDIIERHRVTQFYTAPTAIRAFMKWGDEHPRKHDLTSLKVLGTVGEPINPEAWMWYYKMIGGERCPIVDTWWQTETGGHMITPLPAATPTTPGSCTLPFFGVDPAVVNERGEELPPNTGGLLVIRKPWPSMIRGIYKDRERFIQTYFSRVRPDAEPESAKVRLESDVSPYYFTGDGARRDERGYFWIMGRVDDVINVAGHRLGTMEVESALVSHDAVVEAAVVGMPHEIKGTGIAAFVTLAPAYSSALAEEKRSGGDDGSDSLKDTLRDHVAREIGAIAKPDMIRFTDALPKTRSGKIMRRLLRDIASGRHEVTQDTTTLEDFSVLAKLHEQEEA
jgi:acetyl-CoA synthetase